MTVPHPETGTVSAGFTVIWAWVIYPITAMPDDLAGCPAVVIDQHDIMP